MRLLGHIVVLLLLCKISNGVTKVKPSKKSTHASQAGNAVQPSLVPQLPAGSVSNSRTTGGPGGGEPTQDSAAAGAQAAKKPSDEIRLNFLKNAHVTCNDGTPAGFYLKENRGSRRWLVFLEGGWFCYSKETCDSRYQNTPRLMSSSGWPLTKSGSGILSSQAAENPYWHNANIVFIPYCSSDVWSGNGPVPPPAPKARQLREKERSRNATENVFLGSLIIREVIKDLVPKGIKQAKVVMLSGESAGGTGVLLNIERVASQLEQLGAEAQVRGLVDSGWFLESQHQRSPNCPETVACLPADVIKLGYRLWNSMIPEGCRRLHKKGEEWRCFFGHNLYPTLTSPLFVVQWLFDEELLKVENIYFGGQHMSEEQWQYIQNLGREMKNSLRDVTAVFAPSCLSHTAITKRNWMTFQIKGTSLPRALHCWERSLEATRNNRTPSKGCPFNLVDSCQVPQCNPTCPALVNEATQQKLTLLQMLAAMGLDLRKLGLNPQEDVNFLAGVVSNGG
uniref:carboxylesterase notum2 n=1 Tax=Doryrhamphus excisus TaxID=161450 RepID=UPI0025AD9DE7|nr:carboxylesterase notum2 [Doryrhamphus excisus]XP_057945812.1 carboxylesterase notum2 [Doryrhamphus excisus]XP_057945822.1 carboxylesterase notum2 [Doryrhamphus excisus]XP_057945825.1 carboxylesterase notum2 [Doryrhamphus excisus]XP_057945826.1 carboxylesterase notum2 [Doryrhamphus excisus]